jgi:hypothetical protein
LANREALIPPQCYTKTDAQHNPCYVCHQAPIEGEGHENRMNDGWLQGQYGFSEFALKNRWQNLFIDRQAEVAEISDDAISEYILVDNYQALRKKMANQPSFRGWKPDLEGLGSAARAFDEHGFAKDQSRWVAFKYMPMPSTFWPTNGSTDDVMLRLPEAFRSKQTKGPYVHDVYLANLAILEAAIKNQAQVHSLPIDERLVKSDLDGDGAFKSVRHFPRPSHYVGAAHAIEVTPFLYPQGTEFLHTVRYVGIDKQGELFVPPRMKEVRYMVKARSIAKHMLAGLYDNEVQEKQEGNPPYFADFRDRGIDNGFGWLVQGYLEDKSGALRPNSYEETLFCMGCHSTIGSTIDHTFSFARKWDGPEGFGYIDLQGMPDVPSMGEQEGSILTYLERTGGGSEFRHNDEMQARFFDDKGRVDKGKVRAARDVRQLLTPSAGRARLLNKAYRSIVLAQSFLRGRDATVVAPENVFNAIDREQVPLPPGRHFKWDIRLNWSGVTPRHAEAESTLVLGQL